MRTEVIDNHGDKIYLWTEYLWTEEGYEPRLVISGNAERVPLFYGRFETIEKAFNSCIKLKTMKGMERKCKSLGLDMMYC